MKTTVIIPTYDEIIGMRKILPELKLEWADEWFVIDGGSKDGTVEFAKEMGFKVINQKSRD